MSIKHTFRNRRILGWLAVFAVSLFFFFRQADAATAVSKSFNPAPILMYHYIENPTASTSLPGLYLKPEIFKNQLCELKQNGYRTVFVSELAKNLRDGQTLVGKNIALTFDDGYEDFYTQAFPLLKKYQLKATVYVIINALDKPGYLTKAQVKELARSGLVEIGSHTFNHLDLRTLSSKKTGFEIKLSKVALEKISGHPVLTFCYPAGMYKSEDLEIVSSSGYLGAVSTKPGVKNLSSDRFLLKRIRPNSRSGKDFINWLKRESAVKMN